MKQFILAIAALMTIFLSACSQNNKTKETKKMVTKTLVVYFSATGTTKGVARMIADATKGDSYEIKPERPYTSADLDWTNKQSRSSIEMKDLNSRPEIKGTVRNISDYDTVYIGFPIWWYTVPTIINSFIESNNLKGKTIIPFATSGGSSITKACRDLKNSYPDLNWKEGHLLNRPSKSDIESLVK